MLINEIEDNFLHREQTPIKLLGNNKSTKMIDSKGLAKSKARTSTLGTRYTEVALTMDRLIVEKLYKLYWDKEGKQLLIKDTSSKKWAIVTEAKRITIKDGDTELKQYIDIRPIFLDLLVMYAILFGENEELNRAFKNLAKKFAPLAKKVEEAQKRGTKYPVAANEADILMLCDSFEFKSLKTDNLFQGFGVDNKTIRATTEAAISSGLLEEVYTDEFVKFRLAEKKINSNKPAYNNKSNDSVANFLKKCRNGDFILPIKWDEDMKIHIPPLEYLDDFVPSQAFVEIIIDVTSKLNSVVKKIKNGENPAAAMLNNVVNFSMFGRPSTGKTKTAYAVASTLGMPITSIPLNKRTDDDTYQGMTKAVDGEFLFKATPFLIFFKKGGIIVLEEINLADSNNAMGCLGQALEFPYILMENGYTPVKRNPYTIIIGTRNVGTYGSSSTSQALDSRFEQDYELNDPTETDFKNILISKGFQKQDVDWVYKAYNAILIYLMSDIVNAEELALSITLRSCIGALNSIKNGNKPKRAIKNAMLGKISMYDPELGVDIEKQIVNNLPELY